jgi:protoporphyrinogen oxidase
MLYEKMAAEVEKGGGEIRKETEALGCRHDGEKITAVIVRDASGRRELAGGDFLSSIPITLLASSLAPSAPQRIKDSAGRLKFRSHIAINFLIDQKEVFPDNWIYVHSPELLMGRIQNYKNWSPKMVYNPDITTLGVEYFCNPGDEFYRRNDSELKELAGKELAATGLVDADRVFDGFVARSEFAYPVYRIGYEGDLQAVRGYLGRFANLQCIGRSGQYQYNNMDHSILTGLLAARNIIDPGRRRDIWHTKIEDKYIEY